MRTYPHVLALAGVVSSVCIFAPTLSTIFSFFADAWDDWEDDVEDDDWDDEDDEHHTRNRAVVMFDFLPKAEEVRALAPVHHSASASQWKDESLETSSGHNKFNFRSTFFPPPSFQ